MLPYLKPRKQTGVILATHKAEGGLMPDKEEGEEDHGLMSASEDLIKAVHAKDASAVAQAVRAAFEMLDEDDKPMEGPQE